ncbi:MAG TPA: AraC family transcriptional regulator [Rudaea sp.]|jgi:AraC-like DNA-binding protein
MTTAAPTPSRQIVMARCGTRAASFDINVTAVETVLRRSPLVALGEYRCPVEHPQFSGGGPQRCPFIAFPRSSTRITRLGARPLVYTPNTISLHNIGDVYCREAVSKEGERCDWIAVSPALLRDIAALRGVVADDDRIFEVALAPATPAVYAAQRALFRALRADPVMSMLQVEESTIAIVDAVFRAARSSGGDGHAIERRFLGRAPAIVDATLKLLATEYHGTLSIDAISARAHCSAGYLSRLFRRSTGFTLHEYQQQLRLRASLELLLESSHGLSEVAMQLGFANHSHFTCAFRREFGMTPTEFSRNASGALLKLLQSAAG